MALVSLGSQRTMVDHFFTYYPPFILLLILLARTRCNQLTVNSTIYNLTDNSPLTCFQTCGNETKSVALQDKSCVCELYDVQPTMNFQCSILCPGYNLTLCGNLNNWSIYTKANVSEVALKQIPIHTTGCVTVQHQASDVYTLLDCDDTNTYHLCHGFGFFDCNPPFRNGMVSPNWTFACGYELGGSVSHDRYPVGFSDIEKCMKKGIRDVRADFKYWIGLIALDNSDTQTTELSISPTPSEVSSISTTEDSTWIHSSTLLPSYDLTSSLVAKFENETTHITEHLQSSDFNYTAVDPSNISRELMNQTSLNRDFSSYVTFKSNSHLNTDHFPLTTVHPSTSVLTIHTCSVSTCTYFSPPTDETRSSRMVAHITGMPPTSITTSHSSGNELNQTKPLDSVSTTVAITAGVVAMCALLAVIGMAVYIRRRVTKQMNFGSTIFSEGHPSRIELATYLDDYPPEFQDNRSESVIRSVAMGDGIPNLSGSRRADLKMNNGLTSLNSGLSSLSGRARENEYVLY